MALVVGDAQTIQGKKVSDVVPLSDQYLKWDSGLSEIIYDYPSELTPMQVVCIAFNYTTISPLPIYFVAAGNVITGSRIHIETPFDTPALISIGHAGDTQAVMLQTENDSQEAGDYASTRFISYAGVDTIRLYITPAWATQGAGHVVINVTTSG